MTVILLLKAAAAAAVTTPMSHAPKGLVEALLCSCASPTLAELVKARETSTSFHQKKSLDVTCSCLRTFLSNASHVLVCAESK